MQFEKNTYQGISIDFRIEMQQLRIKSYNIIFANVVKVVLQVQSEILLGHAESHGRTREPHGLLDDAVCWERMRNDCHGNSLFTYWGQVMDIELFQSHYPTLNLLEEIF